MLTQRKVHLARNPQEHWRWLSWLTSMWHGLGRSNDAEGRQIGPQSTPSSVPACKTTGPVFILGEASHMLERGLEWNISQDATLLYKWGRPSSWGAHVSSNLGRFVAWTRFSTTDTTLQRFGVARSSHPSGCHPAPACGVCSAGTKHIVAKIGRQRIHFLLEVPTTRGSRLLTRATNLVVRGCIWPKAVAYFGTVGGRCGHATRSRRQ